MSKSGKNIISRLQSLMDSPEGKTFMNYLYSWGAAIVILGTLFKLTHIPGANLMLFIGMGTEVIVFFFFAFDRPYEESPAENKNEKQSHDSQDGVTSQGIVGGSLIINGNLGGSVSHPEGESVQGVAFSGGALQSDSLMAVAAATQQSEIMPRMDEVTQEYIDKIRNLNEAIQHISEQTEALGRNMEEMETLGRNLTGINALYEIQLRSASNQVGTIDQVNEQTRRMASQIEELNVVYARMLEAMTANMNKPQ